MPMPLSNPDDAKDKGLRALDKMIVLDLRRAGSTQKVDHRVLDLLGDLT